MLVEQRVRNRIIEWLEMVVVYDVDPPPFDLNEVVNQWYDWNEDQASMSCYPSPTYTEQEASSLALVASAMNSFCEATPKAIASETLACALPEWYRLVSAARQALKELQARGRLAEEHSLGMEQRGLDA